MKILGMRLMFTLLAICAGTDYLPAELITFDDPPPDFRDRPIHAYAGLIWGDEVWIHEGVTVYPQYGRTGYNNCLVSAPNMAYNGGGEPVYFKASTPFTLISLYVGAAWRDGLQVRIEGRRGAELRFDRTFTVDTLGPTFVELGYEDITRVDLRTFGGVPHGVVNGGQAVFDDLLIIPSGVPEPATYGLDGAGLLIGLGLVRLWRRKHPSGCGVDGP